MIAIFPEIHRCIKSRNTDKLAVLARVYFGGESVKSPRISPGHLIVLSGIRVIEQVSPYKGALITSETKGSFSVTIVTHPGINGHEKDFTQAHLWGHYFLEIQDALINSQPVNRGFGEDISPLLRYEQQLYRADPGKIQSDKEKEADQFAASLLMPKAMMIRADQVIQSHDKIADLFGVSPAAVRQRIHEIKSADSLSSDSGKQQNSSKPAGNQETANPVPDPHPPVTSQKPLKRLRQLAKKLDDSVLV